MRFEALPLEGAFRIRLDQFRDERGYFARRFCAAEFAAQGLKTDFVQRSISHNRKRGTLRGLHFQVAPHQETKLVRCSRGSAFDVMVDLRPNSPTWGQWHAEMISAENQVILYIPTGYAHGFQTLEDDTEIDYEITPAYVPEAARGIRFDDQTIGIQWPVREKVVSARDLSFGAARVSSMQMVAEYGRT